MDERIRALAKDVDVLCDQFFEAGWLAGARYGVSGDLRCSVFDDSEDAVRAAMHQARSEHWASLRGRFGALMEDM